MSKLFKSKIVLGFMVLAFVLSVGVLSADAYTHSITLRQGMSGSQVIALQQALGITADGAFGPMTKAAVMNFQTAHGLTADGVVGPMTGAALAGGSMTGGTYPAGCTSNSGYSTTTGQSCAATSTTLPAGCTSTVGYSPTTGAKCDGSTTGGSTSTEVTGQGSVDTVTVGSPEETSTSEGLEEVELVSFDVKLEKDGDLKLDRFDLYMGELNTGSESSKPWKYFSSADLYVDGTKVGSLDTDTSSDWSEYDTGTLSGTSSQEYRLRFSGLSGVLKSGETTPVSVKFNMVSNIDSADETATWYFGTTTTSFRMVDGTGYMFETGADLEDNFTLDTATKADLDVSASSTEPDASVIAVDDTSDTNGVTIGAFEVEETENVDVNITEMTVSLTTSDTITDVVKTLYLYDGSTKVGQENVTSGTVTFDNISLDVEGDETVTLTVKADFDDTNSQVRYQNGDTIYVSGVDLTKFTDKFNNDEGDISESEAYTGKTHTLYASGMSVTNFTSSYVKTTSTTSGINDTVEFSLSFDVTAFGDKVYLEKSCIDNAAPASNHTTDLVVSIDGDTDGSSTSCTSFTSTNATEGTYGFEVPKGQTKHFTVTILGDAGEAGGAGTSVTFAGRLEALGYKVGSDAAGDAQYATNMTNYKSSSVSIYDR